MSAEENTKPWNWRMGLVQCKCVCQIERLDAGMRLCASLVPKRRNKRACGAQYRPYWEACLKYRDSSERRSVVVPNPDARVSRCSKLSLGRCCLLARRLPKIVKLY